MAIQQHVSPWPDVQRVGAAASPGSPPSPDRGVYFADRRDAGRLLGQMLAELRLERPVVVGIAPGGISVATEVARLLDAPLQTLVPCPEGRRGAVRHRLDVSGSVVVLVDDQLACAATLRGVVRSVRRAGAARVVLAVPVAASVPARMARGWVDHLVCAAIRVGDGPLEHVYAECEPAGAEKLAPVGSDRLGARRVHSSIA